MIGVVKGILAGIFIGLAAIINLNCSNPVIGSLMFGFGLFIICVYQFKLFTGMIGYFPTINNVPGRISFGIDCLVVWLCNYVGAFLVGVAYRYTEAYANIAPRVEHLINIKLASDFGSLVVLGIFCGMLMFLAVSTFKADVVPSIGIITLFLCVSIFILSGFEHSIADMAYISLANQVNTNSFVKILVPVTIGNALGGIGLCYAITTSQKNPVQQQKQQEQPPKQKVPIEKSIEEK